MFFFPYFYQIGDTCTLNISALKMYELLIILLDTCYECYSAVNTKVLFA